MKLPRKQKKALNKKIIKKTDENFFFDEAKKKPFINTTELLTTTGQLKDDPCPENSTLPETVLTDSQSAPEQQENLSIHRKYLKPSYFAVLFFPLLAFILYSNALDSNFVLDDYRNIEANQAVKMTELTWDSLVKAGTEGKLKTRPLPNITFALNYYFCKLTTRGYHFVNILIHAINGILLYLLFTYTFQTPVLKKKYGYAGFIPLAAAAIWLAHPVQVQSVTYIVQRMNSMATMFYILAMLCYILARMSTSGRNKLTLFGISFFSTILGLGSKEIVASIPFSLLLFEFLFFQNFNFLWLKKNLSKIAILLSFFILVAVIYLGDNPINAIRANYENYNYTMGQRVITEFRVVIFYLKQILIPHPSNLNILHDFPVSDSLIQPASTLLSFLVIVGAVFSAIFVAKNEPLFSFAVLWYFGNLVMESSIINLEIVFEHRSYLPSTFVILAIVTYASRIVPYSLVRKALFICLISILGFWTHSRNSVWANEITFWQDCINKNPKDSRAHDELANAYYREGKIKKAIQTYYQGIQVKDNWKLHYNLGNVFDEFWEPEKAIAQYKWVIGIKPGYVRAHFKLARNYARIEDFQKALWHTKEALRLDPSLNVARANLIDLQKRTKRDIP